MKKRTKYYTAKKVDAAVQAALAAYLLQGGSLPAVLEGSGGLIRHLPASSKRAGVDYIVGLHKRGFEIKVRKPTYADSFDRALRGLYVPVLREQLNQSTILLQQIGRP